MTEGYSEEKFSSWNFPARSSEKEIPLAHMVLGFSRNKILTHGKLRFSLGT